MIYVIRNNLYALEIFTGSLDRPHCREVTGDTSQIGTSCRGWPKLSTYAQVNMTRAPREQWMIRKIDLCARDPKDISMCHKFSLSARARVSACMRACGEREGEKKRIGRTHVPPW